MKVQVIYRPQSEHATEVESYMRDFENQTGYKLEAVNPDTRSGVSLCEVYDIVEYPTIIAVSDDGQLVSMWRGRQLPTINEVSYYVQ